MLRWFYFTLATVSLAWGLAGWASHFLMPAHTLYMVSLCAGVPSGLILTFIPWGRYLLRPLLFAIWPIAISTVFFSAFGTFDFREVEYAQLLNYEFALTWGGALYGVIVFYPRKRKVFDEGTRRHAGWQTPASSMAASHQPEVDRDFGIIERETRELPRRTGGMSAAKAGAGDSGKAPGETLEEPDEVYGGWMTIEEAIKRIEIEKSPGLFETGEE